MASILTKTFAAIMTLTVSTLSAPAFADGYEFSAGPAAKGESHGPRHRSVGRAEGEAQLSFSQFGSDTDLEALATERSRLTSRQHDGAIDRLRTFDTSQIGSVNFGGETRATALCSARIGSINEYGDTSVYADGCGSSTLIKNRGGSVEAYNGSTGGFMDITTDAGSH